MQHANAMPRPTSRRRRDDHAPPKEYARAKMAPADHRPRSATISVLSGSERILHVYPDQRTSSGGTSSRSRVSSGSDLTSDESWSDLGEAEDDGIEPSDSASRSRHPPRPSRRHTVEVREAPSRHSSRRHSVVTDRERERPREELPRRRQSSRAQEPRRYDSHSRPARSTSRRAPSDDSSGTLASGDDYPYSHHGRPGYPPYRQAPPNHGGYPPSMSAGSQYPDPYNPPHQALMRIHHNDSFGYPQPNPFSPTSQQPNPFSPMSSGGEGSNYFASDPMGPPQHHRHHRPDGPTRPQSFVAPHSHYATSELMPAYQQPMPGFGGWQQGYPPYPVAGWPVSAGNSPPPREERSSEIEALKELIKQRDAAQEEKKKDEKAAEIESLRELIKKHEEEAVARQKAWIAEREADAAARAAEKAKIEEEKKRKQEIDEARKKAKEDAEKKAEEAAKKVKEEADKKLAESEKAKEEADKAKKALEDEIAKNKPQPDMLKAPIKFKDAVGRKFSFPWHLCKSWKGMETLIKQAFLHVDVIGDHVHQGHYDLTGPDGEIILPQVWDSMVKPDYEITMHLWPMEEEKHKEPEPFIDSFAGMNLGGGGRDPFAGLGGFDSYGLDPMMGPKKPKKGEGKKGEGKKKKTSSPEMMGGMMPPPPPPIGGGGREMFPDPFAGLGGGYPPGIEPVGLGKPHKSSGDKGKARSKSKSSKEISPLAAWFAGGSLNAKPAKKR